ncbi:spore coat associated protein CotJA [Sedimentibacter sp. MB31-C6]|uniref:spore coat associated protein CotJA n=1 Tax=Sedimentibacter sp. MB31-C6 TaxID=3109366 RepID=UPI002DDD4A0F|nr:spore coat associated protein CotJA [Sedimentibacter sp. MB36-C1]WSI04016.1 spore coat associated protein CotJA [Sedimentibacter sp. MB36-C1]
MVNNQRFRDNLYNESSMPMNKCIPQEMVIENVRLAAAYVPYQKLCELFNPLESLRKGTAFPELYSPYEARDKKYKLKSSEY